MCPHFPRIAGHIKTEIFHAAESGALEEENTSLNPHSPDNSIFHVLAPVTVSDHEQLISVAPGQSPS